MAGEGRKGMSIHQSMMFVGLGGTGCLIGAELERRLREELCGADGTGLIDRLGGQIAPFQLPNCIQFVYADLNKNDLQRQRLRAVPPAHRIAADRNVHLTTQLVPPINTYPEVARSLRMNATRETIEWLPGRDGEPRVTPLRLGAGQLPTVGRAALFETFRHGLSPALDPLRQAVGNISKGGDHLMALSGSQHSRNTCDVFVAFSVAGGTGCGIFYDYLHLIGEAFATEYSGIKIYPLVLMPSAFDEERGGGRPAVLNAGRALLDLFQLVDDQNGQYAQEELDTGIGAPRGSIAVRYPGREPTRLTAGTVQTAFLFSRTSGIEREDLHRSVVSLIMSLIGTGLGGGSPDGENAAIAGDLYQSFADSFINEGYKREAPAPSGIGACGVSTSLVASMTVPVDELADIIAGRLLAQAVRELTSDARVSAETNHEHIKTFMSVSGLGDLWLCAPPPVTDPAPAKGATAVQQALNARARAMEQAVRQQEAHLRVRTSQLAEEFNHARGVRALLGQVDLFRALRIIGGDPRLFSEHDRPGVSGLLTFLATEPTPQPGITVNPPQTPPIKDRAGGVVKVKWGDPEVQQALRLQQLWYEWRSRRNWHAQWAAQAEVWGRKVGHLRHALQGLVRAFEEHQEQEGAHFGRATRELYRQRSGVSYLLPPQGDLEAFHRQVMRRFIDLTQLPEAAGAAQVLAKLLGPGIWEQAYAKAEDTDGGASAVAFVRDRVKQHVKTLFTQKDDRGGQPLLPPVRDLLMRAATRSGPTVGDEDLEQFRQKLAGLLPVGFSPKGSGQLKVLIVHPGTNADPEVRQYLERMLNLPEARTRHIEFRSVEQESIVVILFRSAMSLTEVPEVRQVLAEWARALERQDPVDFLRWRQRLGFNYDWLATTESHRAYILHRLLCAMWNGRFETRGDPASPDAVHIHLPHGETVMRLPLRPFDRASSWGSLLRAYEEWTLTDDEEVRREFARTLMLTNPDGLGDRVRPPHPLYRRFVTEIAPREIRVLRELLDRLPERSRGWAEELLRLWTSTLPAALDFPFRRDGGITRHSLRDLFADFDPEAATRERETGPRGPRGPGGRFSEPGPDGRAAFPSWDGHTDGPPAPRAPYPDGLRGARGDSPRHTPYEDGSPRGADPAPPWDTSPSGTGDFPGPRTPRPGGPADPADRRYPDDGGRGVPRRPYPDDAGAGHAEDRPVTPWRATRPEEAPAPRYGDDRDGDGWSPRDASGRYGEDGEADRRGPREVSGGYGEDRGGVSVPRYGDDRDGDGWSPRDASGRYGEDGEADRRGPRDVSGGYDEDRGGVSVPRYGDEWDGPSAPRYGEERDGDRWYPDGRPPAPRVPYPDEGGRGVPRRPYPDDAGVESAGDRPVTPWRATHPDDPRPAPWRTPHPDDEAPRPDGPDTPPSRGTRPDGDTARRGHPDDATTGPSAAGPPRPAAEPRDDAAPPPPRSPHPDEYDPYPTPGPYDGDRYGNGKEAQ